MVRLVLVTIISNPQKTIQVANSNKLTMKDQPPFLALAAPTSLSLINPLAVGMTVSPVLHVAIACLTSIASSSPYSPSNCLLDGTPAGLTD
jgi:hypothetical protein